jgi:hypothetical protein
MLQSSCWRNDDPFQDDGDNVPNFKRLSAAAVEMSLQGSRVSPADTPSRLWSRDVDHNSERSCRLFARQLILQGNNGNFDDECLELQRRVDFASIVPHSEDESMRHQLSSNTRLNRSRLLNLSPIG